MLCVHLTASSNNSLLLANSKVTQIALTQVETVLKQIADLALLGHNYEKQLYLFACLLSK